MRPVNFFRVTTFVLWVLPLAMQFVIARSCCAADWLDNSPSSSVTTFWCRHGISPFPFCPTQGIAIRPSIVGGEAAAVLLSLGVIFEIGLHFVRRYPFLRLFLRVLWISPLLPVRRPCAMLILGQGPSPERTWLWNGSFYSSALPGSCKCVLLIVAIALMSRLGLTWRDYSLGIAAGFGVYSALDLILLELRAHLHVVTDEAFVLLVGGI